jgi:hypothetical protein
MMDPHIPWLAVLGASLVAGGALILISRGDQRGIPWLGLLGAVLIAIVALVGAALAEPLPLGPGGSCPHGYTSSGSYWVVPSAGAQDAIPKLHGPGGSRPWGWTASGSYCLHPGSMRWPAGGTMFDFTDAREIFFSRACAGSENLFS